MKLNQKGFTLVEIAIVLVIIGLLLGGILKGQEMITQAKIKNAIADFSGVSVAYFGYQDRYRAIPGDDAGAARWGTANPVPVPGNGDRTLSGTYNSPTATDESRHWWDHLRRSGFVVGSGTLQPQNAFNGIIGVQTGNGPAAGTAPAAVLVNATGGGFANLILCSFNLPDKVAIALDVQVDDGDVRTGAVRGGVPNALPTAAIAATVDTANYAETGTNNYTLCRHL